MKTYQVVLSKSFVVTINSNNENDAKKFSEYFTSDVLDISSETDRTKFNFQIENIDCRLNQAFECNEVN